MTKSILKSKTVSYLEDLVLGIGTVMMLHRVRAEGSDDSSPNRGLAISPAFLERFVRAAQHNGYTFVSLDHFIEQLLVGSENKLLVLTFDDGYLDNFTEAYPLLKRMGIPFTIFVTTSFPDGEAVLWWYAIERLLLGNAPIILANGHMLPARTNQEKLDTFFFLRQLIMSLPRDGFGERVNALFKETSFDWRQMCAAEALSWSDLCEMARDPLVTIGAHTVSHPVLSALTPERACLEMRESRELLEARIGVNVTHLCYPFGGRGEVGVREFELAKKLGFKTATTTRWGNIFQKHRAHLHGLPRVHLTNTFNWDDFRRQSLRRFLRGRVVSE